MRGWPGNETVFLLNGRRMPNEYQSHLAYGHNATPNLRGIPIASIERIEILASAGSAIYGDSATGGVINIITRRDHRGGMLSVTYDTPADVHVPNRSVEFSFGMPLKGGMGLRLGGSYRQKMPFPVLERADVSVARWRRLALERDPARLLQFRNNDPYFATSQTYGMTPNIRMATVTENLFANLPGATPSNFTSVPEAYRGDGDISSFTPGVYNLNPADYTVYGTEGDDTTLRIGFDRNFGAHWQWSVDYRYVKSDSEGRGGATRSFTGGPTSDLPRIPAAAPTNPFGQDVRVYIVDNHLVRPELKFAAGTNVTWEASSTLRGSWGEWTGFVDLSFSRNRNRFRTERFLEPDGGWVNAFLTGAYNPFVDPRVVAPAAQEFYENYVAYLSHSGSSTRNYQAAVKVSGPLFHWFGNAVCVTAGADFSRAHRYESFDYRRHVDGRTWEPKTPVAASSEATNALARPDRIFSSDIYAGYVELNLPVLPRGFDAPLLKRLELFASGRIVRSIRDGIRNADEQPFTSSTGSHVHAMGLRYDMVEGVAMRVSRSIGFKPPSISHITPYDPPTNNVTVADRQRNNEIVILTHGQYVVGGHPEVRPETTNSTNLGLIFSPRRLPELRISLDYLENVRNGFISNLSQQQAIDMELELPERRVYRGSPDGHPSGVGPIEFVDARAINLLQMSSRSIDMSFEQAIQNVLGGRLLVTLAATKNLSFKVQTSSATPPAEQIGNPTADFSRSLVWNANAQVRWDGSQWSMGWSTRYFDDILARPSDYLLQGGDRAEWALNHDVFVGYRAAVSGLHGWRQMLSGASVTFGIRNVFDRKPRFWAESVDHGVAPYDSIVGRSVWMRIYRDFQ